MGGPGNRGKGRGPTPPSTAKQKPQAPPTTPNKTAGTVCCGAKPPPCDVFKLTVTCKVPEADSDKTLVLSTTKRLRGNAFKGTSWTKAQEKLTHYDLVMEMHAGYATDGKSGLDEAVDVTVNATFAGKCSKKIHPRLKAETIKLPMRTRVLVANQSPRVSKTEPVGTTKMTIEGVRSHADLPMSGPTNGFGAILGAVSSLFKLTREPHEVLITAWGCGFRKPGDGAPNKDLTCLLRVYRRDVWTFGLKVGPVVTRSQSRTMSRQSGFVQKSVATKVSGPSGSESITTSSAKGKGQEFNKTVRETTVGGNTKRYTKGTFGAIQINKVESTKFGGLKRVKTMHGHVLSTVDKLKASPGTQLILERNGVDYIEKLKFGQFSLKKMVQTAIDVARAAMVKIQDLFKSVKFGFFFEVEASFFDGAFVFEWGPALETKAQEDRYWPVTFPLVFVTKMTIMKVSVAAGAGAEFKSGGAEFGATAKIKLELSLDVEVRVVLGVPSTSPIEVPLKPAAAASIEVEVKASLLGYSIARAAGEIKTGFGIPDGKLKIDPQQGITLEGMLKSDPGTLLVQANVGPAVYEGKWDLWPGKNIYKLG